MLESVKCFVVMFCVWLSPFITLSANVMTAVYTHTVTIVPACFIKSLVYWNYSEIRLVICNVISFLLFSDVSWLSTYGTLRSVAFFKEMSLLMAPEHKRGRRTHQLVV